MLAPLSMLRATLFSFPHMQVEGNKFVEFEEDGNFEERGPW